MLLYQQGGGGGGGWRGGAQREEGVRTRMADPEWSKLHSIPDSVMLDNKNGGVDW